MRNDLIHSAVKRGSMRSNHKYTHREWKNGKWIYYYEDDKGKSHSVTSKERQRVRNAVDFMNSLRDQSDSASSGKRFYSHKTKELLGKGTSWQERMARMMERRISTLPEKYSVVARAYLDELSKK